MHAQVLTLPIRPLNSYPLDFDFFFYLLVIANSSTKELKLYNPLKHSLVLTIGTEYDDGGGRNIWYGKGSFVVLCELFLLCAFYRLLRLLIELAFGSRLLEVGASFNWKTIDWIKLVP